MKVVSQGLVPLAIVGGLLTVFFLVKGHDNPPPKLAEPSASQEPVSQPAVAAPLPPTAIESAAESDPVRQEPLQSLPTVETRMPSAPASVVLAPLMVQSPVVQGVVIPAQAARQAPARTYSASEVKAMEDEKQYHGDDPIVRARLGLPPPIAPQIQPQPAAVANTGG